MKYLICDGKPYWNYEALNYHSRTYNYATEVMVENKAEKLKQIEKNNHKLKPTDAFIAECCSSNLKLYNINTSKLRLNIALI